MNITEVVPKDNFTLYIKSEDGREGMFDVKPYLDSEAFELGCLNALIQFAHDLAL